MNTSQKILTSEIQVNSKPMDKSFPFPDQFSLQFCPKCCSCDVFFTFDNSGDYFGTCLECKNQWRGDLG